MAENTMRRAASLEALLEDGGVPFEILHPGGLALTTELAALCRIRTGHRVLDVASGTGESACHLARTFGCTVTGADHSAYMVQTARNKAAERHLDISFARADAHDLPFASGSFDAVISECTTCALDKQRAIDEMARVARQDGCVGISDLYWKDGAPARLKMRLEKLEGERPPDRAGWVRIFEQAGLREIQTQDRSNALAAMSKEMRKQLGVLGYGKLVLRVLGQWGFAGLAAVMQSEKIFRSRFLGYVLVAGRKP